MEPVVAGSNLTRALQQRLEAVSDDALIEVIVELQSPPVERSGSNRRDAVAQHRERFLSAAQPLEEQIQRLGGTVLERAWINQTLRARLPAHRIVQLSDADAVSVVDTPSSLSRE
jgi:hypothetical protein